MRKPRGFTLIELLVVIAIIGILSTLAVVALNSARMRSRDAKRTADVKQIMTALAVGFTEHSIYPVAASPGVALGAAATKVLCATGGPPATAVDWVTDTGSCTGSVYMQLVPANPIPNGADYTYISADGSTFSVGFNLEGGAGDLPSGDICAKPTGITAGACS